MVIPNSFIAILQNRDSVFAGQFHVPEKFTRVRFKRDPRFTVANAIVIETALSAVFKFHLIKRGFTYFFAFSIIFVIRAIMIICQQRKFDLMTSMADMIPASFASFALPAHCHSSLRSARTYNQTFEPFYGSTQAVIQSDISNPGSTIKANVITTGTITKLRTVVGDT